MPAWMSWTAKFFYSLIYWTDIFEFMPKSEMDGRARAGVRARLTTGAGVEPNSETSGNQQEPKLSIFLFPLHFKGVFLGNQLLIWIFFSTTVFCNLPHTGVRFQDHDRVPVHWLQETCDQHPGPGPALGDLHAGWQGDSSILRGWCWFGITVFFNLKDFVHLRRQSN